MRPFVLFTFFLCYGVSVFSQQSGKLYLDKFHLPVEDKAEAVSYRIVSPKNSAGIFQVKEYYVNDTLKESGAYSDKELFTRHGEFISYYRNGQKKSQEYFADNKPAGAFTYWYSNGQLKEVCTYKNDKVRVDSFYDSLGKTMVENGEGMYIEEEEDAFIKNPVTLKGPVKNGEKNGEFTGYLSDGTVLCHEEYADNELVRGISYVNNTKIKYKTLEDLDFRGRYMKHIGKNLRYPAKARRFGDEGTVHIWLILNSDYTVKKAVLAKGVTPELDAEALRVLRDTGLKFGPVLRRGIAYDPEKFQAPLKFKLAN